jgi:hypothetical protein
LKSQESLINRFNVSIEISEKVLKRLTEGDDVTHEEIADHTTSVVEDDDDFSIGVNSKTSTVGTNEQEFDFETEHTNLESQTQSQHDDDDTIIKESIDDMSVLWRLDANFETKFVELSSSYSYPVLEMCSKISDPGHFKGLLLPPVTSKRRIMDILAPCSR